MNILIVHEVDWLKKVTYEIHHLSELFSLMGHRVFAIDLREPSMKNFVKGLKGEIIENYNRVYDNASVTVIRPPTLPLKGLNRVVSYIWSYNQIKSVLKKYRIDVVLLYSVVTSAKQTIKACKELNVPVVHRTFDVIHNLIRENYLRSFVLRIEKSVYPQFDKVITNTPFMKKWAEEMGAENVIVIPQGVDPNIMKPLPKDAELAKKLGLTTKDRVVMYLGSIESFSGLDFLFEKIPGILKEIPEFKMLIVGGGSHLINLKHQAKKLSIEDKIIFVGYRPYLEVPKYCSLAELCINTFVINEMTKKLSPVKIFDLLSCGKPVLTTPLQGLLHDFPKESETLVYDDLDNFDKKIVFLLRSHSLEYMGKCGREYVQKNFVWNKVAQRMLDELAKMTLNNQKTYRVSKN